MTDNQQKASDIANRLAINANAYHERARELHDEAERIMRQANGPGQVRCGQESAGDCGLA